MPDLDLKIIRVEAPTHGVTPLLHIKLGITNQSPNEMIQSVTCRQGEVRCQMGNDLASTQAVKNGAIALFDTADNSLPTSRTALALLRKGSADRFLRSISDDLGVLLSRRRDPRLRRRWEEPVQLRICPADRDRRLA